MKLSYKFRLYPNQKQIEVLEKNFNFCCFLYNNALQERISFYKKYYKSRSYNDQAAELPAIKALFEEQCDTIYSQSLQQVLKRLDQSYKNFFRRIKSKADKVGFPRYKSADRFRSILFPQSDLKSGGVKLLENKKLKIYEIPGEVSVKWHRELPKEAIVKNIAIVRQSGKYYVVISLDQVPLELLPKTDKTIGIDLGLNSFITTDDGTKFHHPKPYKTSKEKLAYRQRKLASKMRNSKNRQKAKNLVIKTYEKITNIRQDFLHKVALQLVKENDVIVIEKLNIKNMIETESFLVKNCNIADASWGSFAAILKYKAERAGKLVIEVDPKNTSKMCSCCGNINKELSLKDRKYQCVACGNAEDRDINAAKNIKKLGTSFAITEVISEAHGFSRE